MSFIIPEKTAARLAFPPVPGTRHEECKSIAHALVAAGATDAEAMDILVKRYVCADFPEREAADCVKWSRSHPGEAPGTKNGQRYVPPAYRLPTKSSQQITTQPEFKTPAEYAEWWTNGSRLSPDKMVGLSPIGIPEDRFDALKLFLASLYSDTDNMNLVVNHIEDGGKARPIGGGKTQSRDAWIKHITDGGKVDSKAGCWMRMNPCNLSGSGADSAVTDADITDHRFMLLESDSLPINVQLAFFYRLKLPIAAIILSGGGSAHAWVKVGAVDGVRYSEIVNRILGTLEKFGIDKANKNPSRLSRCPSAIRVIGAKYDGLQRLVWLNPNAQTVTDQTLVEFEQSLQFPAIDERPLHGLAQSSISRYEWMHQNKDKLGVPYGIPTLDKLTGGLKPGQTMVVAGETGGGKSTYGLHMVKASLDKGLGVLLFSLEMDKEEIFDLLMADKCSVNRNKFNNGDFSDMDFTIMAKQIPEVAKLPLFIEDSPMTGSEQCRLRTHQLLSAKKIDLVVVDYIQFMNVGWTKDTNREQQVAAISHSLRALARETKLPFVVLSQLNDEGRLRESRVIAHNANVVARISTEREDVTVEITKGRGIPTGKYKLEYDRMFARLKGIEPSDCDDPYRD